MAQYEITLKSGRDTYQITLEAPEGTPRSTLEAMARQELARQLEPEMNLVGQSPLGAELPLQPPDPGAQIPEPMGYAGPGLEQQIVGTRETPRSEGPFEAFQHSTASEAKRMGLGIDALAALAAGEWNSPERQRLGRIAEESRERFSDYPISTIAGQAAPYLMAPARTMPQAIASGLIISGIGSGGDPLETVVGGAAGAAGYMGGRLLTGPDVQLNRPQQRNIAAGEQLGFEATPAMRTGSPALIRAESAMESSPLMQGTVTATAANNQANMNRIAAQSIGESADYVDESLIGLAQDRIGNTMREIASRSGGRIDDQLLDDLSAIESPIQANIVAGKADVSDDVARTIDNFLDKFDAQNQISGEALAKQSHNLRTEANRLYKSPVSDKDLAAAYQQMADAVDDFIARNAPDDDMAALMQARQQWGNSRMLERPGAHNGAGDVSARAMRNIMMRERPSFRKGRRAGMTETPQDQLNAAVRFQTSVPAPYGSSGTAERLAPAQAAAAWYGGTQVTGEPVSGALLGLGVPAVGSRLYGALPGGYPFSAGLAGQNLGRLLRPLNVPQIGTAAAVPMAPQATQRLR